MKKMKSYESLPIGKLTVLFSAKSPKSQEQLPLATSLVFLSAKKKNKPVTVKNSEMFLSGHKNLTTIKE
jgi:hypothetical protein